MIRAVANKRLFLTNEEYSVYNEIIKTVDKTEFNDMFATDGNGKIIAVFPPIDKQVSMVVVYFLFNVMINQRVRSFDLVINTVLENKKRLDSMEKK